MRLAALLSAASLVGTLGSDVITVTGTGGQAVNGGGGGDQIYGGPGPDWLSGEYGPDTVAGRPGNDVIQGGNGGDVLHGDEGDDLIVGGFGHDWIDGGTGDDVIDSGPAPDIVAGGDGDDVIHLGPAGDLADAGPGNDQVYADSGPDVIAAGDGDDVVHANTGNPVRHVDCGPGNDTLVVNPPYNPKRVPAKYVGCETIVAAEPPVDPARGLWQDIGTDAGGSILGTPLNDRLFGRAGADTLVGLAGDDELWGNHLPTGQDIGIDVLDGGEGNDTIFGGRDRNLILGGPGDDQLENGIRTNALYAGDGNDKIILRGDGAGPNFIDAGPGDDTLTANSRGLMVIDCGPGFDSLAIGSSRRVRRRNCERVTLPATAAAAAPLEIGPGRLGISRLGDYRPRRDATLAAAIRAFGDPTSKHLDDNACAVRWADLGVKIVFANFGVPPAGEDTCSPGVGLGQSFRVSGAAVTWRDLRVGARSRAIVRRHPAAVRHGRSSYWLKTAVSPFGEGSDYAVVKAVVAHGRITALAGWIGGAGE